MTHQMLQQLTFTKITLIRNCDYDKALPTELQITLSCLYYGVYSTAKNFCSHGVMQCWRVYALNIIFSHDKSPTKPLPQFVCIFLKKIMQIIPLLLK